MKCLSLFSGVGGFDLALTRLGHEIIGACEIDKYARSVYERHFPGTKMYEDVRRINPEELQDFDLLCGGFPCQSFSIAGKRKGFEDTRGTMFFEIARIVKAKQPQIVFLENVKGLLNHDKGNTFETILNTLDELGYDVEWSVLNSKHFIPQNRERVFIIGYNRKKCGTKVFSFTESGGLFDSEKLGEQKKQEGVRCEVSTIDARYGTLRNAGETYLIVHSSSGRWWGRDERIKINEANTLNTGDGCRTQSSANYIVESGDVIRKLTPLECERLQTFPDNWASGQSDTQRYKQIGNAVTVAVIEHIVKVILK